MMTSGLKSQMSSDLALGHAAARGNYSGTERFGAVVRTEAAGEEAISVGDVHDVAGSRAGCAQRTRHHRCPHVDVRFRVTHHCRCLPVVPLEA